MESIDKLRELAADINSTEIIDHLDVVGKFMFRSEWLDSWHKAFDAACDRIEAEIAERYMELPTDADGKPIHIGDGIRISVNKTVAAEFVRCDAVAFEHGDGLVWKLSENVLNAQNLTVEDILCELVEAVRYEQVEGAYLSDSWIADYADEIRELLGVSE